MFGSSVTQSPVKQDMIWCAEYSDQTSICEFDYNTHKWNDFYSIDKSNIIRFGLIGLGHQLYFEVYGGIFKLLGQQVEFRYLDDGKIYPLTGNRTFYNDIITYKDAEFTFNPTVKGSGTNRIIQYNFGYKAKLNIHGVNFKFQAICQIPKGGNVRFEIKLVSNQDLNGLLEIRRSGKAVSLIDAPLRKNKGGMVNWVMK